jgi:hypothetical protein
MKRAARPVSKLSASTSQRLQAYALAAGAAGVGILALADPAEAKIVYTPAHIPIVQNGGTVELDLNHDGINDFQFSNIVTTLAMRPPEGFHQSYLGVDPVQPLNRVVAVESQGVLDAAALRKGKNVGRHSPFQPGQSGMDMWACAGGTSGGGCDGPWDKVKQAYLGLKFVIKGKTHFGWAHIRQAGETSPTIVGYAYETIPNKRIITGKTKGRDAVGGDPALTAPAAQPGTLSRLAKGAAGVSTEPADHD